MVVLSPKRFFMRVLIVSLNRSCSSAASSIMETTFRLKNYGELFTDGNDRAIGKTQESGFFETEDNYVGKIMMGAIALKQFDYRTFDWSIIDKIVLTTRDIESQLASWLYVNHIYLTYVKGRPQFSLEAHKQTYTTPVEIPLDLANFTYIKAQFTLFREVAAYLTDKFPQTCVKITYEMMQDDAVTVANNLSTAIGVAIPTAVVVRPGIQETNNSYRNLILNYDAVMEYYKKSDIHY